MADSTGRTLNRRYRIDVLIGRGGMSEVYRAYDTRRNYPVAIKVLREDLAEDWEFVRRFRAEADSLSRLAHANIVRPEAPVLGRSSGIRRPGFRTRQMQQ